MEIDNAIENKGLDFGGGNIPKLFRILFFPTLTAMVFDALFVIVDGIFIGHGVGLMFGIGASVLASISMLFRSC